MIQQPPNKWASIHNRGRVTARRKRSADDVGRARPSRIRVRGGEIMALKISSPPEAAVEQAADLGLHGFR